MRPVGYFLIVLLFLGALWAFSEGFPSAEEIQKYVVGPSVQVATIDTSTLGGVTAEWQTAGSGTVFKTNGQTYILTAGHVVERARHITETVGEDGKPKQEVYFDNVIVLVERVKDDIVTGELRLRCKVVKFSPPEEEHGNDLAVLQPYEGDLLPYAAKPLPPGKTLSAGMFVYHVGSLEGELVNSVTFGIIASPTRMYRNKPFIQLTSPARPGSSGGGVFVVQEGQCYYIGMLTRGGGETISLAVPLSRIKATLKTWNLSALLGD